MHKLTIHLYCTEKVKREAVVIASKFGRHEPLWLTDSPTGPYQHACIASFGTLMCNMHEY